MVYLPLMGTERNIAVDVIGSLLAVRAFAAVFSRLFFARLSMWLGSTTLMVTSTIAGALAFGALAAPISMPLMFVAIAILGGALGMAVTTAISSLLAMVASEVRGTANSLRTGGTRLGPGRHSVLCRPAGGGDGCRQRVPGARRKPCDGRNGSAVYAPEVIELVI